MVTARDGMVCSPAPYIVYSSAVLFPVPRIAPLSAAPRTRRRAVPEQEFQPPRRLARPYRPDRDDDEPPPWANLPPVRPARSGHPAGPGHPPGPRHSADPHYLTNPRHPADPGGPATPLDPAIHSGPNSDSGDFSRSGSHRVSDPVQ